MKNSFYVTACRFHTKEKDKLLIIGYFMNNEMGDNRPIVMLDHERLDYVSEERRLLPTCFKEINGKKITKEYFLWVNLPEKWREYRELKIYNSFPEELLLTISRENLLKYETWLASSIDLARKEPGGWRVEGWYMDDGSSEIRFLDMKGNDLSVQIQYVERADVLRAYPENIQSEIVGFSAFHEGEIPRKIRVHLTAGEKQTDEIIKLQKSQAIEMIEKSRGMLFKIKDYYRQFGFQATLGRAFDKLLKREYTDYEQWRRRHQPSKGVLRKQKKEQFAYMPKISIVVPLYRTPEKFLRKMIASVQRQSYNNWELCLSDGSGEESPLTKLLMTYEKKDRRIRVVYNKEQLHISVNTNKALEICTGDYIAFADHDDLLTPDALYECVRVLNEYPQTEMIYSDEDKVNMDGTEYFQPHFKSDFNIDMLRSTNYFCHLVVVKKELYQKVGNLNPICDGAQDYDFVLRCVEQTDKIRHIQKVLYHWRAHQDSTAENPESKSYIVRAGMEALQGHYARVGIRAKVMATKIPGIYRTKYEWMEKPLVSVIIPNKDHINDLKKCICSLEEKNAYHNMEYIIVENNSQDEQTFAYYQELEQKNKKVHVVYWKGKGFNYPAINTFGVSHAKGDYLLFLNNDTEILNSDCIEELLSYCMRSDVGAVGARLYYEDDTIQHAGVIVGAGGVAGHAFLGFPHEAPGYFGRAMMAQDLSAVTAACMMVKKCVYEEVGGFDESYAVAFNDVDLCMKIRKAGYLIVYNPYAELTHYESKSRGYEDTEEKIKRFVSEIQLFQTRWKEFLEQGDPYYNPNLTLDRNDFSLNMTVHKEGS